LFTPDGFTDIQKARAVSQWTVTSLLHPGYGSMKIFPVGMVGAPVLVACRAMG
jgi:hypothetical protein